MTMTAGVPKGAPAVIFFGSLHTHVWGTHRDNVAVPREGPFSGISQPVCRRQHTWQVPCTPSASIHSLFCRRRSTSRLLSKTVFRRKPFSPADFAEFRLDQAASSSRKQRPSAHWQKTLVCSSTRHLITNKMKPHHIETASQYQPNG